MSSVCSSIARMACAPHALRPWSAARSRASDALSRQCRLALRSSDELRSRRWNASTAVRAAARTVEVGDKVRVVAERHSARSGVPRLKERLR